MVPEMMPVAFGTTLLGLGSASSLAAERLPDRRWRWTAASGILIVGAGAVFATLLGIRWAENGGRPLNSFYESLVQAMAGLALGAAVLLRSGPVGLRAGAGATLLGVVLGAFAGLDDPEPLLTPPALRDPLALVHFTLRWGSFGILLAAAGAAGARLLDRRTDAGIPEAWDGALHRVVALGLPCLLASFLVGAVWHGAVWAAPISWDSTETWTLAILFTFVGWMHLRQVVPATSRVPAVLLVVGGVLVVAWWLFLRLAPATLDSIELY